MGRLLLWNKGRTLGAAGGRINTDIIGVTFAMAVIGAVANTAANIQCMVGVNKTGTVINTLLALFKGRTAGPGAVTGIVAAYLNIGAAAAAGAVVSAVNSGTL